MDESMAKLIVAVVGVVGLIFWALAARLYFRMRSWPKQIQHSQWVAPDRGTLQSLMDSCLRIMTSRGWKLADRRDDRVTCEAAAVALTSHFVPDRGGVRVDASADVTRLARIFERIMFVIVFPVALLALIVIPSVIWRFVVPSENPAVQWQSVQILQIVHVLWPPFLIYFLYRSRRRSVEVLAENLPTQIEVGG